MEARQAPPGRRERAREKQRQRHARAARLLAFGSLLAVGGVAIAIILSTTGGSSSPAGQTISTLSSSRSGARSSTSAAKPGTAAVPILAYHVINVAPPSSSAPPALYVPVDEFTAQMDALKAGGWHPVTLDQLQAYWSRGVSLGSGKPIVITFDDGYASQFTNALPVLKKLGWVAVENLAVVGLSPSDGGISDDQVRGLIHAGWQLGAEGPSTSKLTTADAAALGGSLLSARLTLKSRYGVPVNWFSYPSGAYDSTIAAAVRGSGFVGATTLVSGWASPTADRFRLPRLEVVGGTTPTQLMSQITAASQTTSVPSAEQGIT